MQTNHENSCIERTSNTHVQNTPLNSSSIDYLKFRIDKRISIEELIKNLLSLLISDIEEIFNNNREYNMAFKHKRLAISINYHETSVKKCVLVEIKGSACSELGDDKLQTIIRKAIQHEAKFERIDLLRDDLSKLLDIDMIQDLSEKDQLTTRFKQWKHVQGYNRHGNAGKTVYFGSRKSDAYLRIYDKAKEQGVDYHWIRCELEIKHETANKVAHLIAVSDNIGKIYGGILKSKLKFKVASDDLNKARWEDQQWWVDFISECENVSIGRRHLEKNITANLSWILKNCSRSIYELHQTMGDDLFKMILDEGKLRSEERSMKVR